MMLRVSFRKERPRSLAPKDSAPVSKAARAVFLRNRVAEVMAYQASVKASLFTTIFTPRWPRSVGAYHAHRRLSLELN